MLGVWKTPCIGPSNPSCVLFPWQVISGHQLPYSSEKQLKTDRRLYVQIKVTGVESDEQKNKTKIVKNNGKEERGFAFSEPNYKTKNNQNQW